MYILLPRFREERKHKPGMGKQMEVMIPSPNMDFDFDKARSLPYLSTPSTPRRFGTYFYSVPSSPSRISDFYGELDYKDSERYDLSEKIPGLPDKSFETKEDDGDGEDFAFDVSEQMKRISLSAEELFDGGKIRASTPPPQLLIAEEVDQSRSIERSAAVSSKSASSSILHGKQMIQNVFSPRRKDLDMSKTSVENGRKRATKERGRERNLTSNLSTQRTARSLSPGRDSETPWEMEKEQRHQNSKPTSSNCKSTFTSSSSSSARSSKRWSLKDLLLFRSASEGRATDRDPLRKYYGSFRKHEDSKTSSFGSTDAKSAKRTGSVSPHELHYTVNKAISEDMKKRTFLPYNQGILGRLSFNPAIHALSNGFGSLPHA